MPEDAQTGGAQSLLDALELVSSLPPPQTVQGGEVRSTNSLLRQQFVRQKMRDTCYAAALETAFRYGQVTRSQEDFVDAISRECGVSSTHSASFVQILFAAQDVATGRTEWYLEGKAVPMSSVSALPTATGYETPITWPPPDTTGVHGGLYPIARTLPFVTHFEQGEPIIAGLDWNTSHVVVVLGMTYRQSGKGFWSSSSGWKWSWQDDPLLLSVRLMDPASDSSEPMVLPGDEFLRRARFLVAVVPDVLLIHPDAVRKEKLEGVFIHLPQASIGPHHDISERIDPASSAADSIDLPAPSAASRHRIAVMSGDGSSVTSCWTVRPHTPAAMR